MGVLLWGYVGQVKKLAGMMMVGLLIAGCGSGGGGGTFTVNGSLTAGTLDTPMTLCTYIPGHSNAGFSDLTKGADVTIRDSNGKVVGIGELEDGDSISSGRCKFKFTVNGVPDNDSIYSAEIANRGEVSFKRADAGKLSLSMGD